MKTLSFLTYLLRDYSGLMKADQDRLCLAIVDLLQARPGSNRICASNLAVGPAAAASPQRRPARGRAARAQDCPDVVSTRRELIVATRHVLATDFQARRRRKRGK